MFGKMAQHVRLLALLMAKLKGKSKNVTLILLWGNALDFNISKDQCSRIRRPHLPYGLETAFISKSIKQK